jgi:hypothetical protein
MPDINKKFARLIEEKNKKKKFVRVNKNSKNNTREELKVL